MTDGLMQRVRSAVRGLSPGYFALVMATGVVSIGLKLEHRAALSRLLLDVGAIAFVVLVVLTCWRFVSFRPELVEDFTHPLRGFGFYSFVAGANVLAARLVLAGQTLIPVVLLVVASAAWLLRGYAVPWTTHLGRGEHPIVAAANGTWFMWAVAGQSIAVVAASLQPHWPHAGLGLIAVAAWCLGVFLYAVDGVFVAMRLLAFDFRASDLTPPYWIAMGAAAITVLAGSKTLEIQHAPAVDALHGLIAGSSLMFWVIATWLVPALFAMGWWRHVTHRIPLTYDANLWCIVFPLGMYAVASSNLGQADRIPVIGHVGAAWIWVALAAWLLASVGMVVHVTRTVLIGEDIEHSASPAKVKNQDRSD
jgi:tellurite resistance protein TehA-like permease